MSNHLARILSAFLLWFAVSLPSVRAEVTDRAVAGDGAIRIVTANLRSIRGGDSEPSKTADDWNHRKKLCVEILKSLKADIYCFQECRMPQVEYFRKTMPGLEYFARARVSGKGAPGNPVFYSKARFEKIDGGGLWLSETPDVVDSKSWGTTFARQANWIRLRDKHTGREFIVWNTHLDHAVQAAREGQIQVMINRASAMPANIPMILAGDLNAGSDNRVYTRLTDAGWRDTYAACHDGNANPGRTYHGFKTLPPGGYKIDWILTKGLFKPIAADVIKDHKIINGVRRYPSDHFFIYADIVFTAPAETASSPELPGGKFIVYCDSQAPLIDAGQDACTAKTFVPEESAKDEAWLLQNIRLEHPRVFISKDNLPSVMARALLEERALYETTKARADALIGQNFIFQDLNINDGTQSKDHECGLRAADAAFVYLVSREAKYLELAKSLLHETGIYYNKRIQAGKNIHWFAWSQISALAALDWIWPALTPEERKALGKPLLEAIHVMAIRGARKPFLRENTSAYKSGFYGPPCLAWYAGLVFYKAGIDDAAAGILLRKGFSDHVKLLEHRARLSGEAGGAATPVINYAAPDYPWAEFNFFHSFLSATGIDISKDWPHVPRFLYYLYWHWLPGNKIFGYGDENHFDNTLNIQKLHVHLMQTKHFFGDSGPEFHSLANWMLARLESQPNDSIPFARFLLTQLGDAKAPDDAPPPPAPHAAFFKNMGQIFMRSGSGPDDTYALFSSGGLTERHRHYDNNNFIIYKGGFRALDTGTRPQPGQHLTHYYCRTVAHNCILIKMPDETFPKYWGGPAASETPAPVPNDGGQRNILGSEVMAFSQNADYVYMASDATKSYHSDKAVLVLRQFVFIQPDIFIIYDKVTSTRADYKKSWLLHLASEPQITAPNEFLEKSQGGWLACRTVFPENARLEKIGGPGKQFWSDGRNWPLPTLTAADWNFRGSAHTQPQDERPLLGQWRVEVGPAADNEEDEFLHFLQVGVATPGKMVATRLSRSDDSLGIEFEQGPLACKITFFSGQKHGGEIIIARAGRVIRQESFAAAVEETRAPF